MSFGSKYLYLYSFGGIKSGSNIVFTFITSHIFYFYSFSIKFISKEFKPLILTDLIDLDLSTFLCFFVPNSLSPLFSNYQGVITV